jgi:hypothetical protein
VFGVFWSGSTFVAVSLITDDTTVSVDLSHFIPPSQLGACPKDVRKVFVNAHQASF